MTEVPAAPDQAAASATSPVTTGITSIDSVLDLVAGLDARPVAEHAPVFEAAHAELRRVLDDPPAAS
ncbi:hypothetical protein [Nocardioides panacisoli]|uniref:Uncharacterized protein n=1 Tax=Nocardioides panacisoli TaxID=627624 RepID=A0ABP7J7Q7_9ACTN